MSLSLYCMMKGQSYLSCMTARRDLPHWVIITSTGKPVWVACGDIRSYTQFHMNTPLHTWFHTKKLAASRATTGTLNLQSGDGCIKGEYMQCRIPCTVILKPHFAHPRGTQQGWGLNSAAFLYTHTLHKLYVGHQVLEGHTDKLMVIICNNNHDYLNLCPRSTATGTAPRQCTPSASPKPG